MHNNFSISCIILVHFLKEPMIFIQMEPSIQFTVELETNHELSFLDTLIHHHENGTITNKVYRKQTAI